MGFNPGTTKYKDTEDNAFYEADWTLRCVGGTTVSTSVWTIVDPTGIAPTLVTSNPSILAGDLITQVFLSAGTAGTRYKVENKVTLSGTPTQTLERSFFLRIREM